jgi:hypothetical protein
MVTVQGFNTLFRQFVAELHAVFHDNEELRNAYEGFDMIVQLFPRKPLEVFMETVAPHADLLKARDPRLFEELNIVGVDFAALWNSPDMTEQDQKVIWQYLDSLLFLGTAVQNLPEEMTATIENFAAECEKKLEAGDIDPNALVTTAMQAIAGCEDGGKGLVSTFGSLLGLTEDDTAQLASNFGSILSNIGAAASGEGSAGAGIDINGLMNTLAPLLGAAAGQTDDRQTDTVVQRSRKKVKRK